MFFAIKRNFDRIESDSVVEDDDTSFEEDNKVEYLEEALQEEKSKNMDLEKKVMELEIRLNQQNVAHSSSESENDIEDEKEFERQESDDMSKDELSQYVTELEEENKELKKKGKKLQSKLKETVFLFYLILILKGERVPKIHR